MSEEFYVGYLGKAPPLLGRWLRRIVILLVGLSVTVSVALVLSQQPFAASTFEFGKTKSFEGVVTELPFPRLGPYLLAGQGKHGVQEMFRGHDGSSAKLNGSLIHREGMKMIEVEPSSLVLGSSAMPHGASQDLGEVELKGEIVDAKCYLGVMNPGSGHVHRDCAVRCLLGGLPAMFISEDRKMLLENFNVRENIRKIGVPVEVKGKLRKDGEWLILRITAL
jgi:hypothetical protein